VPASREMLRSAKALKAPSCKFREKAVMRGAAKDAYKQQIQLLDGPFPP